MTRNDSVIESFLVWHRLAVHILQFGHEKPDYRVAIVSTINRYRLTNRIFEEEWSAFDPKSTAPNSDVYFSMITRGFSEPPIR